jgi:hypothetical protein
MGKTEQTGTVSADRQNRTDRIDRTNRTNRTVRTDKQIKNKMTIKKWIYKALKGAHLRTKIVLAFHSRYCDIVISMSKTYKKYSIKKYMW